MKVSKNGMAAVLSAAAAALCGGCIAGAVAAGTAAGVFVFSQVEWRHADFSANLYRVCDPGDGNFAVSPYGAGAVLALAYTGATNLTASGMANSLSLPNRGVSTATAFSDLDRAVASARANGGLKPMRSNSIWLREGIEPKRGFIDTAHKAFGSDVKSIRMNEAGRMRVNSFVDGATDGMFTNIVTTVPAKDVDMLLVSAVGVEGRWLREFNPAGTSDRVFHAPGGERTVPFVSRTGAYRFADNGHVRALYLPYVNGTSELVVLLPSEEYGMDMLERDFSRVLVARLDRSASEMQVGVRIPVFTVDNTLEMTEPLVTLGMGLAFSGAAQFPGVSDADGVNVGGVFQGARFDFRDGGTMESGARPVPEGVMARPAEVEFVADRPFMFFVRDRGTGLMFLIGRVADPSIGMISKGGGE